MDSYFVCPSKTELMNIITRDCRKDCDKLRGKKTCPITAVEGFTDSDDIADAFSNHYNELYYSVDYDQDGMNVIYNEVNDDICHCPGNHRHNINSSNIKDVINKFKRGKNDGYDGLTSDYIINPCPPHHLLLFCSCEPTIWRNFLRIIDIYKN